MLLKIKEALFRPLGGFVPAPIKNLFARISRSLWKLAVVIIILASVIIVYNEAIYRLADDDSDYSDEAVSEEETEADDCNVMAIELHGSLLDYIPPESFDTEGNLLFDETASENILAAINSARDDENIKAVLLEVDSYGGSPVAGEEVANALKGLDKPTVAMIRSGGASGAYWAATGADKIFASANSDVGSIGVTMSYVSEADEELDGGLVYNQLSAGKFKDSGDPNKSLSAEEKKIFMRDVNIIHENFIAAVVANRNLDAAKVRALADGSTMLGQMALENGLIDAIGSYDEAKEHLKEIIGEEAILCWY